MNRLSIFASIALVALLALAGCAGNSEVSADMGNSQLNETQAANVPVIGSELKGQDVGMSIAPIQDASGVERVEIIHFHGTHQCYSCITVGQYAEETVNAHFADELKSGKITFAHLNGELPENQALVMKYGVTSASLWIGVYDSNGFHKEQNIQVWYKINNKADYMAYLEGVIEKRLAGDYS
jgi:hypothetical protein